jgi:uncharacterized protein (DUF1778 family)
MRASARQGAKRDTLNIRIKPEVFGLIDRAAELVGKNRTGFLFDAARHATACLDCTVFVVNSNGYAEFISRPNERLRRSLETAAPWEW